MNGFSGEDGIRTHAPVKTNGFQDRPVMTTSVPLHNTYSIVPLADDLFILSLCFNFVNTFIWFFLTFLFLIISRPQFRINSAL